MIPESGEMGKLAKAALVTAQAEEEASPEWLASILSEAEEEERQEEELAKVPVTHEGLLAFAEELIQIEQDKLQAEADLKQLMDRRKQLRTQLIPDAMRELKMVNSKGKGNFTYNGFKFHLEQKLFASVTKANKPILFAHLQKTNDQELIASTISEQVLSAYVRECRADGRNDPPGVSVHEEVTAKMTKAK